MKRRTAIAALLAALLVLAVVIPAAAAEDDGYDFVLATGITGADRDVNVYEGPGLNYPIVYTLLPESALEFYDFQTADGIEWGECELGWVNMEYVTLDGEPIDPATITAKGKKNGVAWVLYTDGTLSITDDCTTNRLDSSRPAPWKDYADQVRTLRFEPGSIGYAGNSSFRDMVNLETVYVSSCPFSVQNLFLGCENFTAYKVIDAPGTRYLEQDGLLLDAELPSRLLSCPTGRSGSLELPGSVTIIGGYAFQGCNQLEEIILPEGLDTVDDFAFSGCTGLRSITFPAATRYLCLELFDGCTDLETVYFEGDAPETSGFGSIIGRTFGDYVESRDPKDTRITATAYYPADNPTWSREAMAALGGSITWVPVGEGTEPAFPDGVIAVGEVSSSTGSLNIRRGPGTVYEKTGVLNDGDRVEIYDYRTVSGVKWGRVDIGWISMAYVQLDHEQPEPVAIVDSGDMNGYLLWWKLCADGKFFYSGKSGVVGVGPDYYPWHQYRDQIKEVITMGNTPYVSSCSFRNCINLTRVSLCESLESIDSGAFSDCTALESVTIPASVTQIDSFSGCTALKEVILAPGSRLETIGTGAFGNSGLRSISLPDTVRTIGDSAFRYCADLAAVTLRDGITYIGWYAFADCPALTGELYLSETIEEIKMFAFDTAPGFTRVTINTNAAYALDFSGSTVLTSVTYGGNAHNVGVHMFRNCTALEEVIINGPITHIRDDAFAGCTALKEITLPETLTTIDFRVFEGSGLTSIVIPDSVTKLSSDSFANCTALTRAHVGTGITTLDNGVFQGCTALECVSLPAVQSITYAAFSGCTRLKTVEVSDDLHEIGREAFSRCHSLNRFEFPAGLAAIYEYAFSNCTALTELVFTGDAPYIDPNYGNAFRNVTATVRYPAGNPTWTESVMVDYGGHLTWVPADEAPAVVYGDVNSDGNINILDLIMLRQYLADWDVTIDETAASVNGDSVINILDLIMLRQYLADWDVTLGG